MEDEKAMFYRRLAVLHRLLGHDRCDEGLLERLEGAGGIEWALSVLRKELDLGCEALPRVPVKLELLEVARHLGRFTDAEQAALCRVPFSSATLRKRAIGYLLSPDTGISIAELIRRVPEGTLPWSQESAWRQFEARHAFVHVSEGARWRLVSSGPADGSLCRAWGSQSRWARSDEHLLSARQTFYVQVLYYLATESRLFQGVSVRCPDDFEAPRGIRQRILIGDRKMRGIRIEPANVYAYKDVCVQIGVDPDAAS